MERPAAGITLAFLTRTNNDISFNASTQQLVASKPLTIKDPKDEVVVSCTSTAHSKSVTITIVVLQINNLGPVWEVDGTVGNSTEVSIEENQVATIVTPTKKPKVVCDGRDDSSVDNYNFNIIQGPFSVSSCPSALIR